MKAALKELSFHVGGYKLRVTSFWRNMALSGKGGGGIRKGELQKLLMQSSGDSIASKGVLHCRDEREGSGWAALTYCYDTGRPLIMQVEKHNTNVFPGCPILLVLDVWEHAYYLELPNDRAKFVESFWNIVNWDKVSKRLAAAGKK